MARKIPGPIQQYRGTTAQHSTYTGPEGELTVDTTKKVVVVHDGVTAGGVPMAREDRKVTGDTHVQVNGGTEGTLASDVAVTLNMDTIAADLVSGDANNGLSVGTDNKLFAKAPDADLILREGDKILHSVEGKVAADLSMSYDQPSGVLNIIGHDGTTVVSTVTIPSSTSALKGVDLVVGKPDAAGEDIPGDYHLSIALRGDNNVWTDPIPVVVNTTKGTAGTTGFTLPMPAGATTITAARAIFNSDDKTMEGAQSPIAIAFNDTSSASIAWTVNDQVINGSLTFTPQVGLVAGTYLHFVWLLSDGGIRDTYVDVTDLIDIYTAGNGVAINSKEISVKLGTGLKFDESGNVVMDFTNVISSDADNAIKQGADGKLTVKVVSSDAGNLIRTGSDKGALLTADDLSTVIDNKVDEILAAGICADINSATAGNQIVCDNGKLFVASDYGTMGE